MLALPSFSLSQLGVLRHENVEQLVAALRGKIRRYIFWSKISDGTAKATSDCHTTRIEQQGVCYTIFVEKSNT